MIFKKDSEYEKEEHSLYVRSSYKQIISLAENELKGKSQEEQTDLLDYLIESMLYDICGENGNFDTILSGESADLTDSTFTTDGLYWYYPQSREIMGTVNDFRVAIVYSVINMKSSLKFT